LLLGHHREAVPVLRILVVVLDVVQRVVERVVLDFFLDDAQDGAGFRVALDFELFDVDLLGRLGDDVERIGGAASLRPRSLMDFSVPPVAWFRRAVRPRRR
jgi:hypothetical protein